MAMKVSEGMSRYAAADRVDGWNKANGSPTR